MTRDTLGPENPLLAAQRGSTPEPFAPWTPKLPADPNLDGLVGLARGAQAGLMQASTRQAPQPQMPTRAAGPDIFWNAAKQQFHVQGHTFAGRDAQKALETKGLLGEMGTGQAPGPDWTSVPTEQYAAYLASIENPTRGTLFKKNFASGVDQLKDLGGSALQAFGAEETGAAIRERASERLREVSPYQREFTDIPKDGEGAVLDWFVSVLGSQGPMVLQSVAAAMVGGLVGGPVGGALMAGKSMGITRNATLVAKAANVMKRKEYADKVTKAATAYRAGTAELADKAILRQAASFTGAAIGAYGSAAVIGTGDVYGEMREQGADPGALGPRVGAMATAVPYAFLETITEFFIAARLLGVGGRTAAQWGKGPVARTTEFTRRAATGIGVYGTAEALTEGSQEALVLGASGQNMLDDAAIHRYINGMAAGFAVGGVLGGPANLRSRYEPANLLAGEVKEDPLLALPPPPPRDLAVKADTPQGPPRSEFTGPDIRGSGPQGVLPFGEFTKLETARRSGEDYSGTPGLVWNPETAQYDQTGRETDALQLPAPPAALDENQMQLPLDQQTQTENMFLRAQQQQQQQQQQQAAEVEQSYQQRWEQQRQEQINLIEPEVEPELPMAQERVPADRSAELAALRQEAVDQNRGRAPVAQLRQMAERIQLPPEDTGSTQSPLFNQRQTPRPSRAERLRRGMDVSQQRDQELVQQGRDTARDIALDAQQGGAQTSMLTQRGEPTVAALKSAGDRIRRPQPVVEPSEPQTRPAKLSAASQSYVNAAKELGYSGPSADLEQIGMAAERAGYDWMHYEAKQNGEANYNERQAAAVEDVFAYSDQTPTEAATIEAYTEGMAGEFPKVKWTKPKPEPEPPKPKAKSPAGERLKKAAAAKAAAAAKEAAAKEKKERAEADKAAAVAAAAAAKQKEKTDAVQKRSAAKVDAREQAEDGEGVRGKDTKEPEPARARSTEKEKETPERAVPEEGPVQLVAKTPAEQWAENYDFPFESLPDDLRKQWEEAFPKGKATGDLAQRIYSFIEFTPTQAMLYADPASMEFADAADTLLDDAFFITDSNQQPDKKPDGPVAVAREFMREANFTPEQRAAINEVFIAQAEAATQRDAFKRGKPQAWFSYAMDTGQLGKLRKLKMNGIPSDLAKSLLDQGHLVPENLPASTRSELKVEAPKSEAPQEEPGIRLAWRIEETNDNTNTSNARQIATRKQLLIDLWEQVQDEGQENTETRFRSPLKDYFNKDGTPRLVSVNGKLRVINVPVSDTQQATMEAIERSAQKGKRSESVNDSGTVDPDVARTEQAERKKAADVYEPDHTYEEWSQGGKDKSGRAKLATTEGKPINGPLPRLKLKQVLSNFVRGLAMRPKFWIYKDVADLKARNPELYKQAKAARVVDDFDGMTAMGYSFDRQVILFSDRLFTEQGAKFVLAHETLGHFGLRGIIPQDKFDALMTQLYNENPRIRGDVDAAMNANKELGRAEAVEEYLSDYAAILDTSVVMRVWNAIKGALNKLGVKFGDESARYFVYQARRYVREGQTSSTFNIEQVFNKLYEVEYGINPPTTGRFAAVAADDFVGQMRHHGLYAADVEPGYRDRLKDFAVGWDKFKSRFFSLSNFRARDNPGAYEFERRMDAMNKMSSTIKVSTNELLRPVLNRAIVGKVGGISDVEVNQINKTLYAAQWHAISKFKESALSKESLFYFDENGALQERVGADGKSLAEKLSEQGRITFEMMRDGFEYTIEEPDGNSSKNVTYKHPGIDGLKADSLQWTGYLSLRKAVHDLEVQHLAARYIDATNIRKSAIDEIGSLMLNNRLRKSDREFVETVLKTFRETMMEGQGVDTRGYPTLDETSSATAYEFIKLLNKAVIGQKTDWITDLNKFMRDNPKYFKGKLPDDIMSGLDSFRERVFVAEDADNKYVLQNKLKDILLADISKNDADLYVKRTLATGYTPIIREGSAQVRVTAVDAKTGKPVRLLESYRERLIYSMFAKSSEAISMAKYLNEQLAVDDKGRPKTYEAPAYDPNAREYSNRRVRLVAVAEAAKTAIAAPPELNFNEFVRGLHYFDMQITPKKMQQIITALTSQNHAARKRLMRSGTPGDKGEGIKAIARYSESRASTIAKTMYRSQLADLMNMRLARSQQLWNANEMVETRDPKTGKVHEIPKLEALANRLAELMADPEAPEDARRTAQQEHDRYKYMVDTTNKTDMAEGNKYYNEASRTLAFLDANKNIDESDFGTGLWASRIRAGTSLAQLGGSIATGSLNLIALFTNSLPYLISYNHKNGFGGGYGLGPSVAAMHTAGFQVGLIGYRQETNTAMFYDKIADSEALQRQYGLKEHEARFIAKEIREGIMIPALSNSLIGTARGMVTTGVSQHLIDKWMLPFNLTEQASRRTLGLATYRLEYARQRAAMQQDGVKLTTQQEAAIRETARQAAVSAIQMTLGEYSVLNRPAAWRSGIQSFMYMYKVFPTTSIQLLSRMSRGGQAIMLGSLWLMGGLMATPFSEDIEDLIDTIGQAIGWRKGSIRFEVAKALDELVPGSAKYFLDGGLNAFLPGNVGVRIALGDFFPGTGVLLAGSDTGREMQDIMGPAASALLGTGKSLTDLARVPFSKTVSALDVAREAPITIVRAAGDAYAYMQNGAIIDRRGYVVSRDVNTMTIAARLMGYYPVSAAREYQAIRMAKRVTDYQRDTVASFRHAWIKAMQVGDREEARQVVKAVDAWNAQTKGTALEIRNFLAGSQRALREAQRPASDRLRRGSPIAARDDIDKMIDLATYND